jgi:hypothetical protein
LKLPAVFSSLILLLLLFDPVFAQRKGDAQYSFSPAPYKVGERLTYDVSFSNFLSVAHVELMVAARGNFDGREGIQLRAHVQTSGVINAALFAINNDYISYVDSETGTPFRSQQILRDSSRISDPAVDPGQPSGVVTREAAVSGGYDLVSAIYRLRAMPLADGAVFRMTVRGENNEEYQAEIRVSTGKAIKTAVGSFNTLVGQIHVNDSQIDNYRLKIYFSDDERHIPILVTARHRAGEIRAELAGSDFIVPAVISTPTPAPTPIAAATPKPVVRNPPPTPSADLVNLPFKVGEQLNYQVYLGSGTTPVGTVGFQIRGRQKYFDRDGLFLSVKAQTTGAAARLFVADDLISTYVDPRTLLPFRCEMTLREGKRRLNQALTVNQDHGTATTDKGQRIEIPVGTHDYISFFYAVRTFSLGPPKRNAVSMLVENKPKTIFITSLKRETIQLGTERVPAIAVSITSDDPQADKFMLRAWISDDARRLPLRLTAQTEIGPVRADLAIVPVVPQ